MLPSVVVQVNDQGGSHKIDILQGPAGRFAVHDAMAVGFPNKLKVTRAPAWVRANQVGCFCFGEQHNHIAWLGIAGPHAHVALILRKERRPPAHRLEASLGTGYFRDAASWHERFARALNSS